MDYHYPIELSKFTLEFNSKFFIRKNISNEDLICVCKYIIDLNLTIKKKTRLIQAGLFHNSKSDIELLKCF